MQIEEDGRRFNQLKCQIDDLRRRQHDKVISDASLSIKYFYYDNALFFFTFSVAAIWLYKLIVATSDAPLQVTAFGGDRVLRLYKSVEKHKNRFKCPPVGPIGHHVVCHNYLWLLSCLF